jgi:ketosteroid isomerase-like protein
VTNDQHAGGAPEGWVAASPEQLANTHRLFEAWNRGEYETWIEGFATDCEWYPSTVGGVEGHSTAIRGHEELWAFVRQAEEVWELFRVEVDDDLRRGNLRLLLGSVRARGRLSGVETATPMFWVSEQDERWRTVWNKSFLDLDEALVAAAEREGGGGPA